MYYVRVAGGWASCMELCMNLCIDSCMTGIVYELVYRLVHDMRGRMSWNIFGRDIREAARAYLLAGDRAESMLE
jgi:hypothetical protein